MEQKSDVTFIFSKYETVQLRKNNSLIYSNSFMKNKYDRHEPTTTTELQAIDFVEARTECPLWLQLTVHCKFTVLLEL